MYCLGFAKHKSKLILIQKSHPDFQLGKLNGVGGHLEGHEEPIEAMTREFLEETGTVTDENQWTPKGKIVGDDFEVFVFEATLRSDQFNEISSYAPELIDVEDLIDKPDSEVIYIVDQSMIEELHVKQKILYNVKNIIMSKGKNNVYR